MIRMLKRPSFRTVSQIFSKFSSVFDVEGRPGRSSSSTSSRPFMNHLCHSETRVRDIKLSPYSFNILKHPVWIFFQFNKKFQIDALLDFHPNHESTRATQTVTLKQSSKANQLT
jgi:hypothetical protein